MAYLFSIAFKIRSKKRKKLVSKISFFGLVLNFVAKRSLTSGKNDKLIKLTNFSGSINYKAKEIEFYVYDLHVSNKLKIYVIDN